MANVIHRKDCMMLKIKSKGLGKLMLQHNVHQSQQPKTLLKIVIKQKKPRNFGTSIVELVKREYVSLTFKTYYDHYLTMQLISYHSIKSQ